MRGRDRDWNGSFDGAHEMGKWALVSRTTSTIESLKISQKPPMLEKERNCVT